MPRATNETEKGPDKADYITGLKLHIVLFGLALVGFVIMLDQTIVSTAIPRITNTFNSIKDIGWYGSAYMLSLASLQPLYGKIYQYYSSKNVFLVTLALFEIGSLICALANSSDLFIVGRALAGTGGSGLFLGILTILAASVPLDRRPKYLGIMMGCSSLGLVCGPIFGGLLTERASWRWCFYMNLPVGGITGGILAFMHIPDSKQSDSHLATREQKGKRLDIPGFILFTPTIIMLLLALEWGGVTYRWNSSVVIGLFCGAGVAWIIFLLWERRQGEGAMIPLELFTHRITVCSALTMMLAQGPLLVVSYYLPVWFQVVKNVSPITSGVFYIPSVGTQMISSVLTGILTSRLGYYTPFATLGMIAITLSCALLTTLTPTSSNVTWIMYQVIGGLGRGMVLQQPLTAVQASLPPPKVPVGTAFLMFSQVLSGALFISFGQTVFSNQLGPALARYAPDVNAALLLKVGATNFRSVVSEESVERVVQAYNLALTRVFFLGVGASIGSFFASWGMGWINLKTKKMEDVEAAEAAKRAKTEKEKGAGDVFVTES
ncbi:major facilitator superfamily domain-containing protein [Hyaloscypha sp. PMI_1271]|nr:major facilitator superfamily domain-containing protein [Hyaloscypha sp. PMI_1271]